MRFFLFFLSLVLLIGCETTDHPGFKRLEGTVHYRLLALGDDDRKIGPDSYVTVDVKAYDMDRKALARKQMRRVKVENLSWPAILERVLHGAVEGDSIEVIGSIGALEAGAWFRPIPMGEDSTLIQLDISIEEVLTAEEVLQLRAEERAEKDRELEELARLQDVLDSLNFSSDDRHDGIYFRSVRPGNGVKAAFDNEVMVRYRVYLADGSLVDDTYMGQPLEYHVGRPDQVLLGFASAIARMSEGEEALFVLPSDQAFGERGSSSGIVPPFAALIYEAKLVKVSK